VSRTCPDCQNQYEDEILHCPEDGLDLATVEPDDELIGRSIGSYRVVKPLGKGGMGAVYMAEHPVIGSKVAIKFLHPQYATDQKIVDRFLAEARAVNVIGHDNILKILDLNVTEDNRHYFVMEFLYGKALQDIVKPDVPVPLEEAGPILLQTCEALQAAHDHKIIHRDLKPDNVYLIVHKGRKNFVKVVDFGIAKVTDDEGQSTGKTQTGMVMGTPAYMSPEQAGGMTNRIDGRSDIYSLGCMMFQMATGKLPFPGSSFGEVLIGHLQLPPPEPRSINPDIPEEYQAIILKCLAKDQDARFQTMRELHDAIGACMDAFGITRELPLADAAEVAAGSQGPKTKSSPGGKTKAGPRTALAKKTTAPPRATVAAHEARTQMEHAAPLPPPRSSMGLIVGISVGALALVGGVVGFVVWQQGESQKQTERLAHLAASKAAEEARKQAEAAASKEKEAGDSGPVFLSVVSDPLGAKVDATWKGGEKTGETPLALEVPKNVKVHFSFARQGYLPYAEDVIADSAQVVKAPLTAEPRVANSGVARPSRPPRGSSGKAKAADPTNDSTIPVEF
jgi:serine/threonine protein kinase